MGKPEDEEPGNTSFDSPSKRHKKHKKHKHKHDRKRRELDDSLELAVDGEDELVDVVSPSQQPAIKLKIKLAAGATPNPATSPAKLIKTSTPEKLDRVPSSTSLDSSWQAPKDDVFMTKKAGDDTSDEEREWLDALEAGKLDDNGEVKKEKDDSLLTSRQRALRHGKPEEQLLELPSGYKQTELTEDQLVKRQQKAKKRREQAHVKQEKDKKQTLDRLLKKQDSFKKSRGRGSRRMHTPCYRYHNTLAGVTVSVPPGFTFPFPQQQAKSAVPAERCGVAGCDNPRKYSCSQTGTPLCSLQCYKSNLASRIATT